MEKRSERGWVTSVLLWLIYLPLYVVAFVLQGFDSRPMNYRGPYGTKAKKSRKR